MNSLLPPGHRVRRLIQLYVGLTLYGFSMALMIRANLGLDPWDAFHQGIASHLPWTFGTVTIVVGAAVLLLWIPLRQRPGVGTISNVVVIGLAVDAGLRALPVMVWTPGRWTFMLAAIVLNGIAGGCYIGAGLGPGPRDGLMTGLVRRTGGSIRIVRTTIELTVLAIGWLMGGTVGIGTVLYAVGIGPIVHLTLPLLTVPGPAPSDPVTSGHATPSVDPDGLRAAA